MGCDAEFDAVQVRQLEGRAEARGLLLHVFDQLRPLDAVRPAGKFSTSVVMESWPPGSWPSSTSGFRSGACGVDGRGKSGAAGAKNDGVACVCHEFPVSIVDGVPICSLLVGARSAVAAPKAEATCI